MCGAIGKKKKCLKGSAVIRGNTRDGEPRTLAWSIEVGRDKDAETRRGKGMQMDLKGSSDLRRRARRSTANQSDDD